MARTNSRGERMVIDLSNPYVQGWEPTTYCTIDETCEVCYEPIIAGTMHCIVTIQIKGATAERYHVHNYCHES